jgi:phosphatidylglycerophosphatase A
MNTVKLTYKHLSWDPRLWFAVGFGAGLSPIAPGTMGTLVGLYIYLLLPSLALSYYVTAWVLVTALAIYSAHIAEKKFGVNDHPGIVCDEMVGFWLATFLLPCGIIWILAAFGLFRLFDIWKPWPISWVQRHVPGGFGCVGDDLLAGLFSMIVIQIAVQVMQNI